MRKWLVDSRPVDIYSLLSPLLFLPFTHRHTVAASQETIRCLTTNGGKLRKATDLRPTGDQHPRRVGIKDCEKRLTVFFQSFGDVKGLCLGKSILRLVVWLMTVWHLKCHSLWLSLWILLLYIYELILTQKYIHIQEYELHRLILTAK